MFLLQYNTLQLIEKGFEILCTTSQTMKHNAELEDTWNHMKPAILIHGWHELSNISSIHTESFKGTIKNRNLSRGNTRYKTYLYFHQPRRHLQGPRVRAWRLGTSGVGGQSMPQKLGLGMVIQRFCGQGMRQVQYITIWHDDIWYKHSN